MSKPYFCHPLLRARDWQHRPQLDRVRDWWGEGGRGICALIGMGGASKTAVAERFLRGLPDGLDDPDVSKDESLRTPHSVFVYSFYGAPNPETFFSELQYWIAGDSEETILLSRLVRSASSLHLVRRLEIRGFGWRWHRQAREHDAWKRSKK
ncbi:MAG: hypothetical protein ACI8W8_000861 [Rhodothermales bacterium]|jgi:hypothetical protein